MIAYKLLFNSPLHLSAGHEGYEKTFHYIHSDTLFSAILSNWHHFYEDSIESMIQNLSFKISSAFPFFSNDYYFPKPYLKLPVIFDEEDYKAAKKLMKVKFIEREFFERILRNEVVHISDICFSYSNRFMSLKKTVTEPFGEREISRNVVDRIIGSTDIFYFSEIVFKKDCGLFFMARFNDETLRKKFEAVLRFLGDEGIGSDRHVGKGQFEINIDEKFFINQPENADSILNLSLYHPTPEEIKKRLLHRSSYDIINRKGWITTIGYQMLRRKSMNMFLEGSVFSNLKKDDYGDIPVVAEKISGLLDFNVYRYGKGFFVGCNYGETHDTV